jgi:hypothetical protein
MMQNAQQRNGGEMPVLVHTDLEIVDDRLRSVALSGWRHMSLFPDKIERRFGHQIIQPSLWGPTMMLNRSLVDIIGDIPNGVNQDAWISMIASRFGKIVHVDRATMKYRRHGNNSTPPVGPAWKEAAGALVRLPEMNALGGDNYPDDLATIILADRSG